MKEKKKRSLLSRIVITLLMIVISLYFLIPWLAYTGNLQKGLHALDSFGTAAAEALGVRRYASDYDLAAGESKRKILGKWTIRKKEMGWVTYLDIYNPGVKEEEMDYLDYLVFDKSSFAKSSYEKIYKDLSDYVQEEGEDWFTAWLPGVCDAEIIRMYYRCGCMIICADIDVYGTWGEPVDAPEEADPASSFDRYSLKDYIILHADDLKKYVLREILPGQTHEEERENFKRKLTGN